jgi:hypothetical protein
MRVLSTVTAIGLLAALTACGTHKKSDDAADQPAPNAQPTAADDPALPEAAIVRVPVDAKGEPTGEPEMRIYSGDAIGDDGVQAAWDASTAPAKVVNSAEELDADTSTQSWTSYSYISAGGWGGSYGNGYGNGYGYNNGYGYGAGYGGYYPGGYPGGYQPGYGCGSYSCYNQNYFQNYYRPVLGYGGNSYNYGVYTPYNSYGGGGGYNYYCYSRPVYY